MLIKWFNYQRKNHGRPSEEQLSEVKIVSLYVNRRSEGSNIKSLSCRSKQGTPAAQHRPFIAKLLYEGWNFNSGNYLFTTDTK